MYILNGIKLNERSPIFRQIFKVYLDKKASLDKPLNIDKPIIIDENGVLAICYDNIYVEIKQIKSGLLKGMYYAKFKDIFKYVEYQNDIFMVKDVVKCEELIEDKEKDIIADYKDLNKYFDKPIIIDNVNNEDTVLCVRVYSEDGKECFRAIHSNQNSKYNKELFYMFSPDKRSFVHYEYEIYLVPMSLVDKWSLYS